MTRVRPFLSLDLETTGLDVKRSEVLQIGWVVEDGVSPLEELKRGSCIIKHDTIEYGEVFALKMNAWIFEEITKKPEERTRPVMSFCQGLFDLQSGIQITRELAAKYDEEVLQKRNFPTKVQLAGKNVSHFDWPLLLNAAKRVEFQMMENAIDHRFLDAGPIFYTEFGRNPGFNEINKLIGYKPVTHDALEDALNVVVALRYAAARRYEQK